MDMMRTSASKLKAKLGQFMKAVRAGHEVIVTDRDQPVARIIPYRVDESAARRLRTTPAEPSAPPLGRVRVRGVSYRGRSTTELLRDERLR